MVLKFNEVLLGCLEKCGAGCAVAKVQTKKLIAELERTKGAVGSGIEQNWFLTAFCEVASN